MMAWTELYLKGTGHETLVVALFKVALNTKLLYLLTAIVKGAPWVDCWITARAWSDNSMNEPMTSTLEREKEAIAVMDTKGIKGLFTNCNSKRRGALVKANKGMYLSLNVPRMETRGMQKVRMGVTAPIPSWVAV